MKLLVVGQNPSTKTVNNATLKRLAQWMDAAGVHHWSFVNMSSNPQAVIPSPEDRMFLWKCVKNTDQKIIALGTRASIILKYFDVPHVQLPHPSGLNRQLNDPRVEQDAIKTIRLNAYAPSTHSNFRDLHQS